MSEKKQITPTQGQFSTDSLTLKDSSQAIPMQEASSKQQSLLPYYGALMLCVLAWASVPIAAKTALDSFEPITFAWLRGITGFLFVLPFAIKRGFKFKSMLTRRAMFYGLMAFVLNTMVMQIGMQWCSANVASILMATMPVLMLTGGIMFLSEKMSLWKGLGALLATAGIVITCLGGSLIDANTTIWGIIIVATAPLTWTVYSIFLKKKDSKADPIIVCAYIMGCGSLLSLPLMLGEVIFVSGIPHVPPSSWLLAAYAGAICLGVGNVSWNVGVAKIDASITGLLYNTCPIIGVALSVFFGETISTLQTVGCAVVILGIIIGVKKTKEKVPSDPGFTQSEHQGNT